ncbi:hypothetical protein D9611_004763 [Ephemerocybe angulata]|uniref:Alcohol acetyltransferase n=1 Tax=Ephemerocybe angulata TaxID=980116 RepID=A0A8H5B3Z3_9AGAR|nr:hypothetical protein D9611_004763 [Tulosesus angulatus]
MASWTQVHSHNGVGTSFERPLGSTELGFYWDSVFRRTADIIRAADVEIEASSIERVLAPATLTRAWTTLKRRYPLMGARIEERSNDEVVFIVEPVTLSTINSSEELLVQEISGGQEVEEVVDRLHNGQSPLSNSLLTCIRILRRKDRPNLVHILIHSAHCIADEIAHNTILRELLQILANPALSTIETSDDAPLKERLGVSASTDGLYPFQPGSARSRWRKAISWVILSRRRAGMKGGHSLPRKVTTNTNFTPAHSRVISSTFSLEDTAKILEACRNEKLTVGSVLPAVAQVAMARVMARRYLQGKMSQKEWDFRKVEPMINAGPLNLRPFLKSAWYESGGSTNASLAIGFYFYQLPFMSLGSAASLLPGSGLPGHLDMLSKTRFFYRCQRMKQSIAEYVRHPLFCEMNTVFLPARLQRLKGIALDWRSGKAAEIGAPLLSPEDEADEAFIINHGGATLGNLDSVLPHEYSHPGDSNDNGPALKLLQVRSFLHCRPAELYLGASTFRHKLKFHIFWDGHVYEDDVVKDWLKELIDSTLVYLT